MDYRVTHTTSYAYSEPVLLCQNLAHVTPRTVPGQRCRESTLIIHPRPAVISSRVDFFGNSATFFSLQEPHRRFTLTATHRVEVIPQPPLDPGRSPPWEEVRDALPGHRRPGDLEAYPFVFGSRYCQPSPQLAAYALGSFTPGRRLLEGVLDLTSRIHRDFLYDPRATTVSTPLPEVFAKRRGVCQDFAHLQIASLRALGLPARYVSGYLSTNPPPGQERLIGADATHAWLSVYCPEQGWFDVDPTNNQVPTDKHILLGWGRDYDDVSPIKGVILGGGQHTVCVSVDVNPLDHDDDTEGDRITPSLPAPVHAALDEPID